MTPSFAQILKNFSSEKTKPTPFVPYSPQMSEPAHLAFLLGSLQLSLEKPQHFGYPRRTPQPPPRKIHALTVTQKEGLCFFQQHGEPLNTDFFESELKASFRHLALKLHPDQGGSAQEFQKLKRSYDSLKVCFQSTECS